MLLGALRARISLRQVERVEKPEAERPANSTLKSLLVMWSSAQYMLLSMIICMPLRRQFYYRDAVAAVAGRGGGVGADEGVLGEHLADGAAEGAGALAVDDAQLG